MKLNDTWFGVETLKDSKPVIIRGRQYLKDFIDSGDYRESIEVMWDFDAKTPTGIPTSEENAVMQKIENALVGSLETDLQSILTVVYTFDNQRTWIFYTKSTSEFVTRLNDAVADYGRIPISLDSDEDPNWELYAGILANNKVDPG